MIIIVAVPRTTDILAIEAETLTCPACGNTKKFIAVTQPCLHAGRVRGFKLRGVTCQVCDTTTEIGGQTAA